MKKIQQTDGGGADEEEDEQDRETLGGWVGWRRKL